MSSVIISNVSEIALSCNEIYGTIPKTQITVIKAPRKRLFPYLSETKSAKEEILCCLEIRMIFLRTRIHKGAAITGPKYIGRKLIPEFAAIPILP